MPPDFIIVGASKTGTEWLKRCSKKHPDVYVAPNGNPNYFSHYYNRDLSWYKKQFARAGEAQVTVDKSTSYIRCDEAPKRIYDYDQNTNLIFILRDPIERVYSHYCMLLKSGDKTRKIEKEIKQSDELLKEGLYYNRISLFRKYFSEERISILLFENLKKDPKQYWKDFLEIVGARKCFMPKQVEKRYHTRGGLPRFLQLYRSAVEVNRYLKKKSSTYQSFYDILYSYGAVGIFKKAFGNESFPEMTSELDQWLCEYYREDVKRLVSKFDVKPKWAKKYT